MTDADHPADDTEQLCAPESERALLGVLLEWPDHVPDLIGRLNGDEFYSVQHETIWRCVAAVHAAGHGTDWTAVTDEVRRTDDRLLGYLPTLIGLGSATMAGQYIERINEYHHKRSLARIGREFTRRAMNGETVYDAAAYGMTAIEDHLRGLSTVPTAETPTIDELLAESDDDEPEWIVPGLLERQDRLIVTAPEGHGKSTLLRQLAVQFASGIHPFEDIGLDPLTVLLLDCENTRRQSRRKLRPLRIQAGDRLIPERLRIELRPAGIDLTTPDDRARLLALCDRYRPDILIAGPVYKMANGNPNDEESAKPVAMSLDAVRDRFDCAVILEAHSAKRPADSKHRPIEPYGWSGWLRWPEFGYNIGEDGELKAWRGPRDERDWPTLLKRGGAWPWTAGGDYLDSRWHIIRSARVRAGQPLTMRKVADATGLTLTSVARVIGRQGRYSWEWTQINRTAADGPEDDPRNPE